MGLFYHGKRFHDNLFGKYFARLDSLLKWGGCGGLILKSYSIGVILSIAMKD